MKKKVANRDDTLKKLVGERRIINLMNEYPSNPSAFPQNLRKINNEYGAGMETEIKLYEFSIEHPFLSRATNPILDYLIKKDLNELGNKSPQIEQYLLKNKKKIKGEEKTNLLGFDINFLAFLMILFIIAFIMRLI